MLAPRLQVVGPIATGHLLWRSRGQLHLTLVAKSTFSIVPGGVMTIQPPDPIATAEVLHGSGSFGVHVAPDLVPYLARADVLFTAGERPSAPPPGSPGHPEAPRPPRLALLRDGHPLVDTTVRLGADVSFAPVPRRSPSRQRLLAVGTTPEHVDAEPGRIIEVPEGFDWAYFQAAPPDQQTSHLRGDEVLVLEGLHPGLAHVESRLAGITILGRIGGWRPGDASWHPLGLRADTLWIDGGRLRATLTWRGTLPVHDPSRLGEVQIQLLSSRAAETAWWPDWDDDEEIATRALDPAASPAPPTRSAARTPGAGGTMVLESDLERAGETEQRKLGHANTMLIVDEPTIEADPAVVELDLELVLSQVMSSEPTTAGAGTTSPSTARELVHGARQVPVVTEPPLAGATIAWQWDRRRGTWRTLVFKAIADLVHGGAALVRDVPPILRLEDETEGEPESLLVRWPSDVAPVKPRVDVVLIGHARTPAAARNVARGEVRFAFGSGVDPSGLSEGGGFDRRVRVFGDRTWRDVVGELLPGQPEAFTAIPLRWDRAFGGPGWDANPVGIGYAAPRTRPVRLPNLEWPERPIVHPRDKVKPASFGPVPRWWAARVALEGKSDEHHQHAPVEQRLESVTGDEPFVLEGTHAAMRRVEGTLPGERARAFLVREGAQLEEVKLRLDAVTFDADALVVELTWRGVVEADGPDARDLVAVYGRLEPLGAPPASLDVILEAYRARTASAGAG